MELVRETSPLSKRSLCVDEQAAPATLEALSAMMKLAVDINHGRRLKVESKGWEDDSMKALHMRDESSCGVWRESVFAKLAATQSGGFGSRSPTWAYPNIFYDTSLAWRVSGAHELHCTVTNRLVPYSSQ